MSSTGISCRIERWVWLAVIGAVAALVLLAGLTLADAVTSDVHATLADREAMIGSTAQP